MWSDECHLRNNNKEDKGSVVVIWDEDDYLKEAEGQLSCKEIYEEVTDDPIPYKYYKYYTSLEIIWKRDDTDISSLKYFEVEEPKFGRFYLLLKAHYIVF